MKEVFERHGYQTRSVDTILRGEKLETKPIYTLPPLFKEEVKKGDVSLAPFVSMYQFLIILQFVNDSLTLSLLDKYYSNPVFGRENNLNYITHVLKNYPSLVVYDERGAPISIQCTHTDGCLGIGKYYSYFIILLKGSVVVNSA